jgi:hypothetical protein
VSGAGAKVGLHHDTEDAMYQDDKNELQKELAEAAKTLARRAASEAAAPHALTCAQAAAALAAVAIGPSPLRVKTD